MLASSIYTYETIMVNLLYNDWGYMSISSALCSPNNYRPEMIFDHFIKVRSCMN